MSHVGRIWGHMYTQFEVNRPNPSPSGYCFRVIKSRYMCMLYLYLYKVCVCIMLYLHLFEVVPVETVSQEAVPPNEKEIFKMSNCKCHTIE